MRLVLVPVLVVPPVVVLEAAREVMMAVTRPAFPVPASSRRYVRIVLIPHQRTKD